MLCSSSLLASTENAYLFICHTIDVHILEWVPVHTSHWECPHSGTGICSYVTLQISTFWNGYMFICHTADVRILERVYVHMSHSRCPHSGTVSMVWTLSPRVMSLLSRNRRDNRADDTEGKHDSEWADGDSLQTGDIRPDGCTRQRRKILLHARQIRLYRHTGISDTCPSDTTVSLHMYLCLK